MSGIIPLGKQQFFSNVGTPLALGTVTFYIPGTTTLKDTWQDAGKVALNTNPVGLDISGRATIYGDGSYRQILKDAGSNTIWDITVAAGASGPNITDPSVMVDQFAAKGQVGVNDQAAFQAAVAFAQTNGIATITLSAKTYELWCPTRTTDPVYGYQVTDGIPIYITGSLRIVGVKGRTVLKFLNSTGGTNDTITQNPAGTPWRGYGIVFNPATLVDGLTLEDFEMDGTKAYYFPGAPTNAQSDITHKAVACNPTGSGDFRRVTLKNIKAHNWGGEIVYLGGGAASVAETYECELYNTNQSAYNPTGLGRVTNYNLIARDAYLASEEISGAGRRWFGGRLANCYNAGAIGTQSFNGAYPYSYPFRDTTKAPTFVEYLDTVIENVGSFNLSSWSKARIKVIDSQLTAGATGRDIYVDADWLADQGTATNPLFLNGPATLTTQIPSAPAGVYYTPLTTTQIKLRVRRTQKAVAAGFANISAVQIAAGLIDSTSVRVQLEGEFGYALTMTGTPVTGQIQPKIDVGDVIPLIQPFAGSSDSPAADTNYTPNYLAMALQPTAVGPVNLGMANSFAGAPYVCADGQIYTFYHNGTNGNLARFRANGPLLGLKEDRILANKGDILAVKFVKDAGLWEEFYFSSSRQTRFVGSASITPASLATATQVTLGTVTVTNAAVGDVVVGVSANVTAAGVRLWGDVTAANTVTVYARNDSGVAWNPGATTFTTRVEKI